MAVYSTAVSPLYFTDEQTETIKPALTCRGSPYSTIIFDIQTDPWFEGTITIARSTQFTGDRRL